MTTDPDRCAPVRARLLEADPRVLRGEGDDSVARHLRACAACRARADRLLAGAAALDAALARLSADAGVDAVPASERRETDRITSGASSPPRASEERSAAGTFGGDARPSPPPSTRRSGRWRPARWAALPLTVAAAAAILLVGRPAGDPRGDADAAALRERAERLLSPAPPGAEAKEGVAVIRTADPDVTLVWLLP